MARRLFHFSGTVEVETEQIDNDSQDVIEQIATILSKNPNSQHMTVLDMSACQVDTAAPINSASIFDVQKWLGLGK
jgi:hypothetical protein